MLCIDNNLTTTNSSSHRSSIYSYSSEDSSSCSVGYSGSDTMIINQQGSGQQNYYSSTAEFDLDGLIESTVDSDDDDDDDEEEEEFDDDDFEEDEVSAVSGEFNEYEIRRRRLAKMKKLRRMKGHSSDGQEGSIGGGMELDYDNESCSTGTGNEHKKIILR